MPDPPRRQRVAAYAVILRDDQILLSRLAPYLVPGEQWTLPGGGIDFGEDPRDAVVREVHEETGLDVEVGDRAWIDSARRYASTPDGSGDDSPLDMHSVRMVFEGWAPVDAPEPRVIEEDGSTVDARWVPVAAVLDGSWPVAAWVRAAIEEHEATRVQRLAAKALVRRGDEVLLTRLSRYAVEAGQWTLPGGGVDHGERPAAALARELLEETGLVAEVGELVGVHDLHLTGTAPNGRHEDFHAVNLVFLAEVPADAEPAVLEIGGTTDDVQWIPLADVSSGVVEVTEVVRFALASAP
ncbi:NUDIX domain-containing protein [Nocardioides marmoriginsengisoli]|uniref:NUDIX domain-containing protein n=1 Tax=Nocardioides marmoriginsengisoli TaxID=661483 RepID=A0A3N0CD82_9ACTN|nr:NUDIX domain-containing protein [Nocardioides marmoriginsengisoli]